MPLYLSTSSTKHLSKVDPVMAQLIERVGPVTLKPRRLAPFQSVVQAIIYQQLSGKAAETILGRFRELFGNGQFPTPEQVLKIELERLRAKWKPYRSTAAWYLWRAVDST